MEVEGRESAELVLTNDRPLLKKVKGEDCHRDECALRILPREDLGPETIKFLNFKALPHNPACDHVSFCVSVYFPQWKICLFKKDLLL